MKITLSLFVLALLSSTLGLRAELQPGDALPPIAVKDQHKVDVSLEPGVQYLLVSFDMPAGKAANKFLEEQGADFLSQNKAVFLSNIFGMPWVGRKFALSKMRDYPHRILIANDEHLLDDFPKKESQITVFELDETLQIIAVEFWDPKAGPAPISD